jgi:tripeptide aminopeptidase
VARAIPALLLVMLALGRCATASQPPATSLPDVTPVMTRPDVAAAMSFVDGDRERTIAEWRAITEIPAPSGKEARRAEYVEARLREYGLTDVRRDSVGNVIAVRKGTGDGARVVFDAHLDTVFAEDVNVTTRIENGRIYAPGVGDDSRNVAALLAMVRAMNSASVQTRGDVIFAFTVEEETGFRGVNQFLADSAKDLDRYVTLDGGYTNFTYGGIGIYWYRYHFIGPGGHTRSVNPPWSATLPVGRAIERIYALKLPADTWMNVGMLGAGDVFNAKADDAWFTADLRSNNQQNLQWLEREVEQIVAEEARRAGMTVRRDVESKSEVASIPGHRNSEMVRTTEAVWRAFGFDPEITDTASNHTSAALLAGVPAIGTGVGPCERTHSIEENCEIEPVFTGIRRNIVLAVALAEHDRR